jgi:hypothetical protein
MLLRLLIPLLCVASLAAQTEWRSLFDGRTLDGWMWSTAANPPAPSWAAIDGTLQTTPGRGEQVYLLTKDSFRDFELSFEWKTEEGGNSGIKYRFQGYWDLGKFSDAPSGKERIEPIALEYQLTDDERHPDALGDVKHSTGAIYEYKAPDKAGPARAGVWHESRIVARGLHVEHWLDGRRVVAVELDSPEMQKAFAASGRKGSSALLAKHARRESPLALQFHDGHFWFRNIRVREWK